mmetsp:Transcript_17413/g.44337  ORF Transcript_17413/g.44337 Transcript_17413/m.44337 type:complete len:100 (+) Transcript_17413:526-825(+)
MRCSKIQAMLVITVHSIILHPLGRNSMTINRDYGREILTTVEKRPYLLFHGDAFSLYLDKHMYTVQVLAEGDLPEKKSTDDEAAADAEANVNELDVDSD